MYDIFGQKIRHIILSEIKFNIFDTLSTALYLHSHMVELDLGEDNSWVVAIHSLLLTSNKTVRVTG